MTRGRAEYELEIAKADLAQANKAKTEASLRLAEVEAWVDDAVERVNQADAQLRAVTSTLGSK